MPVRFRPAAVNLQYKRTNFDMKKRFKHWDNQCLERFFIYTNTLQNLKVWYTLTDIQPRRQTHAND